jgi:hypothetical protein
MHGDVAPINKAFFESESRLHRHPHLKAPSGPAELLTFLHALRDVESDIRSWCRSLIRPLLEAAAAGRYADAADR